MLNSKLQPEDQNSQIKAYEYAVFLLGIRLRTEGELREKLKSKKYKTDVIDSVINQLKDQHYIDDQRFAEVFLDNLKKYKNFGYYGIKKKMMEKRLSSNIIENVLSEGLNEEEEQKIAERYLKKQETLNHSPLRDSGVRAQQKIALKLRAKGFRSGVVAKIIF